MEVATTNNHSHQTHHHSHLHHHHHLHLPHQQRGSNSSSNNNTTVAGNNGAHSPFQREVREWQRIDPDTGALMTGRLEADRWINGPLNSYGKISDSQNISQPNGTQHTQRKQLEVLQARTANGAMQVIRSQTVQTTSSRWSSATSSPSSPILALNGGAGGSSLYHNHSHVLNTHPQQQQHHHQQHLAETGTNTGRWPIKSPRVDICEVNDEDYNVAAAATAAYTVDDAVVDEDKYCLINGNSGNNSSSSGASNGSICNNHYQHNDSYTNRLSNNFLLLDTAPSLKLSNLMKSTSSISSNNSSHSNNSTTTTTPGTMHTHKSAAKVSLHAIVGNSLYNHNNSERKSASASPQTSPAPSSPTTTTAIRTKTSTAKTTSWQQSHTQAQSQRSSRVLEQPALYGSSSSSNSLTKSRVGVTNCDAAVVGNAAALANDPQDPQHLHQQHHHHHQHQHHSNVLTPTQLSRQPQRDLESFRHYNEHGLHGLASSANVVVANDDDDLRLIARHQQREQNPISLGTSLHRSRSISTDDLSTEWDQDGGANEEPSEWRRVSKLRRSFQSSSATTDSNRSPLTARRPLDLPSNSVSVSRIRADLENGRRLNTAMRNNHVDLAALDTILNGTAAKLNTAKRDTFLTAESLKEIRGKLKKLSDESLYKEDFVTHQQPPAEQEHIEVQHVKRLPDYNFQPLTITEQTSSVSTPIKSAFHTVQARHKPASPVHSFEAQQAPSGGPAKHTTNSLESRQKARETASTEWHLRRKSYGFEKMSPPDEKCMFSMDASTDSGLGRSGELGNWSPTDTTHSTRGTVVHFGEPSKLTAGQRRYTALKTHADREASEEAQKRHSIAVDECQYVRENLRKTSQVHLNGLYEAIGDVEQSTTLLQRSTQQKRVEFCKTEVHFAAESGRVNIVETDGKPPPTNNFRRRRRTTSGPLQSLVKSTAAISSSSTSSTTTSTVALPMTHFGDDRRLKTIASTTVAYRACLVDEPEETSEPTSVTVSLPKLLESQALHESSRNSYASTSGVDTTDENDEISAIRGILKNKPIKPKPYHLGENIESADALWGVQLKPLPGSGDGTLTSRREGFPIGKADSPPSSSLQSVADRVRFVEKRQDYTSLPQTNGYSTKINLSLGETPSDWSDAGQRHSQSPSSSQGRRPSAQELMLHDLREHQRILDEGLKSTSLIIKTMRSASEFDEAMRRLSIASMEAAAIPPIVVPTPMLRSQSYQETTRRYSNASLDNEQPRVLKSASYNSTTTLSATMTRRHLQTGDAYCTFVQPIAAPRLKLLGNTEIPVSQQLSQLRRMYEVAATQEELDSADEEVKSYFRGQQDSSDSGGGTQESSSLEDERSVEYSSSWSRLKTKRTVWNIEPNESNSKKIWQSTELPKSNVMSIELHSPQATMRKPESLKMRASLSPPIAKPRTIANAAQTEQLNGTAATMSRSATNEPSKEQLRIIKEARGARKLREHELSFFGVQVAQHNVAANAAAKTKLLSTQSTNSLTKRTLPLHKQQQRNLSEDHSNTMTTKDLKSDKHTITKWQLVNDKPDLLRHSPIALEPQLVTRTAEIRPTERKSLMLHNNFAAASDEDEPEDFDEHFYENITNELTPTFKVKTTANVAINSYDRKTDLKRDAMILTEMSRNADQTLKALSDEAALKDQRRRSLQRRSSKPLETIDEKTITAEKINDKCIAVKVSRSTLASEAKRTSRHSTPSPNAVASRARTSSQSSVESCPRARSRSLSSEHEYENLNVKASRTSAAGRSKLSKSVGSRSSSRESQRSAHTLCSSGDEINQLREERRTRTKRLSSATQLREKRSRELERGAKQQSANETKGKPHRSSSKQRHHQPTEKARTSTHSSTTRSSQRERTECPTAVAVEATGHQHHHRMVDSSSSIRRRKEGHDLQHKSTRSSGGTTPTGSGDTKHERTSAHKTGSSGVRLVRSSRGDHESAHRSSNRSERGEREKEVPSRSRGHSSRSTTAHNSTPSHMTTPPKHVTREHKKAAASTTTATKTTTSNAETKQNDKMIHSKNSTQHSNAEQSLQPQQHIQHGLTTATITAKQRERHGKDRK